MTGLVWWGEGGRCWNRVTGLVSDGGKKGGVGMVGVACDRSSL